MTEQRVRDLIAEDGLCYLDIYVAREFAAVSGRPETLVLGVIREQERKALREESGRGKFERARERACLCLASGWENYAEVADWSPAALLESREPAWAYGVLARREAEARS